MSRQKSQCVKLSDTGNRMSDLAPLRSAFSIMAGIVKKEANHHPVNRIACYLLQIYTRTNCVEFRIVAFPNCRWSLLEICCKCVAVFTGSTSDIEEVLSSVEEIRKTLKERKLTTDKARYQFMREKLSRDDALKSVRALHCWFGNSKSCLTTI